MDADEEEQQRRGADDEQGRARVRAGRERRHQQQQVRDERVNAGIAAYEAALKADKKTYMVYMYEGKQHGFHNDTTPRYDEASAKLAWTRTLEWFNKYLR